MALRRRFLPVFKKHAPRGKPRFAKPLQGHFGPAAKHSQKHKNRPKIGRFSHFNPSAEMHPFSLFSASKAPQKWLCDAICRKKQLFAGSFGSRSHSFCSFTVPKKHILSFFGAAAARTHRFAVFSITRRQAGRQERPSVFEAFIAVFPVIRRSGGLLTSSSPGTSPPCLR